MSSRRLGHTIQLREAQISHLKNENKQLKEELKGANGLNEVKEQLCDFAAGAIKTKDAENEELKKEIETVRRRLNIRERSVKQFLASATKEETTAAALEAQAQQYLEMVKGQQTDIAAREKEIAARDQELSNLKWQYEHAKRYEKCAVDLQELVEALLVENRQLCANQK